MTMVDQRELIKENITEVMKDRSDLKHQIQVLEDMIVACDKSIEDYEEDLKAFDEAIESENCESYINESED